MRTLTNTQEDYLRAIYYLGPSSKVHPTEIARYLNLTKQTVTERLQVLAEQKLVYYKRYSPTHLTKKGTLIAKKLTRKHRIIESFLYTMLKRPKNKIHEEAHALEHAFSDASITALYKLLGKPEYDPHGSII